MRNTPIGHRGPRRAKLLRLIAVPVALVAAGAIAACGGDDDSSDGGENASASGETLRMAWLYTAPRDDRGFNSAHAAAEEAIAEKYGDQVEVVTADNLPYTDQTTQIARQFVAQGADVLVDTSGFGNLFTQVCTQNQEIHCIQISPQEELPENMTGWTYNFPYASYVGGYAAGQMTESDTVGYVVPSDSPRVTAALNGYALGCLAANPDCVVRTVTINTFYDPPKENQAVNTLADAGADVVTAFVNGQSFCGAAERRGIRAIGIFTDALDQCPESTITSTVTNYEPLYSDLVDSILDGTWQGEQLIYMPKDLLGLGGWNEDVPEDVQSETEQVLSEVQSGELDPFAGPIRDNDGKVRVPEGEAIDEEFLYSEWDWYVENIR